eukprot:m.35130 g.35130  ORF g.35130 m.35130 type:complete len:564 (+) comp32066_c1_seq2:631-2322(+)
MNQASLHLFVLYVATLGAQAAPFILLAGTDDLEGLYFNGSSAIDSITQSNVEPSNVGYDDTTGRIYVLGQFGSSSTSSSIFYSSLRQSGLVFLSDSLTKQAARVGLAVDWLNQTLYWGSGDTVNSYHIQARSEETVVSSLSYDVTSVAIDPKRRVLYVAGSKKNKGTIDKIIRSPSGWNRKTLLTNLKGSMDLTVDQSTGRVYWLNRKTKDIGCIGCTRTIPIKVDKSYKLESLTFFEDNLYFYDSKWGFYKLPVSNWETKCPSRCNTRRSLEKVLRFSSTVNDFEVVSFPQVEDAFTATPTEIPTTNSVDASTASPTEFLTKVLPDAFTSPSEMPTSVSVTSPHLSTTTAKSTASSSDSATEKMFSASSAVSIAGATHPAHEKLESTKAPKQSNATLIIAIAAVLPVLALLIAVIVIVLWRKSKRRSSKTLNGTAKSRESTYQDPADSIEMYGATSLDKPVGSQSSGTYAKPCSPKAKYINNPSYAGLSSKIKEALYSENLTKGTGNAQSSPDDGYEKPVAFVGKNATPDEVFLSEERNYADVQTSGTSNKRISETLYEAID